MNETMRSGLRWLCAGYLLALASAFGQTYFIATFVGHIRADLGLSAGGFGALYTAGTIASAVLLMSFGRIADAAQLRWIAAGVVVALAATTAGMAVVSAGWALLILLFGLRFFGQGLLIHIAMTAMGRWFPTMRGKAVAIVALGFPTGEALLPTLTVLGIDAYGWRTIWLIACGFLLLVTLPAILLLLAREPVRVRPAGPAGPDTPAAEEGWTRAEVLRDPMFFALQPGILAPPFVLTGIFISQTSLVAAKGWQLAWFAASVPVYAAVTVACSLVAGVVVDRLGARRVLPLYLLPLAASALTFALARDAWLLPVAMAFAGLTAGGANTLFGALWAELYGTAHLGAVRGLATSGLVFASALAPGMIGGLMDVGFAIETLLVCLAGYTLFAAATMAFVAGRLGGRGMRVRPRAAASPGDGR
ncbi:MFS transporter [Methylobrevis albus]|uniref:MFS transporter n=1 Tax=Methylobrevis albus TaxID=2793297 RepID=A0A931I2E8_9HYPH|nr:MFS transporter [Methylobrevis albus]MBH0238995.1 MFS transporter [Methylobrevis albus]